MGRRAEIGNVQLYPNRPLRPSDHQGYVLQFYCPIQRKRVRRRCGTRNRREAKRIQREVQERLINGTYIASGGALTEALSALPDRAEKETTASSVSTWDHCVQKYLSHCEIRLRASSLSNVRSRLQICGRILASRSRPKQDASALAIACALSGGSLEYLQVQLLNGAEGKYSRRSPMTVNSIIGEVLTFARYCQERDWIAKIPTIRDLELNEVPRGRPLTPAEFERMLDAVPDVVGIGSAEGWRFLLRLLWESGFRVADALQFHWTDPTRIHPVWPIRHRDTPVIVIPSTQKNGKHEEIPMLPGLQALLEQVPAEQRTGSVVGPLWTERAISKTSMGRSRPRPDQLDELVQNYSNSAIARAFGASEQAVRKWLTRYGLHRPKGSAARSGEIPVDIIRSLRQQTNGADRKPREVRLSKDRVSKIISAIGRSAGIVVCPEDRKRGIRIKYASAHDLRRSLAERLFNMNISAETLMVLMRHQDFSTTRKFYGAKKTAQAAAREIKEKLIDCKNDELVGSFVGRKEKSPQLSAEEIVKLKSLLDSL